MHLSSNLGLLKVLVELTKVDLVERSDAASLEDLSYLNHLLSLALLRPRLGKLGKTFEKERELFEVRGVKASEARTELLDVGEKSLTDSEELSVGDTDAVEGEDGVDEVVCFVDDDDVAEKEGSE